VSFSGSTFGRYTGKWLIIVGAIELALAAVFVVLAMSMPSFVSFGMWLTAAILGLTGIALLVAGLLAGRRAAATDEVLQTGMAGSAAVTGVTQTGMYLNEQPQLRLNLLVSLPNQVPYATTHTSFVPLMLMGRVTSGAPLAVRVDPADLNKVVIDWSSSGFASAPQVAGMSQMAAAPQAPPQPAAGAPVPASISGSRMDESLAQVQAALGQPGAGQPALVFASPDQAGYTVEQLRDWLRQNGVQASARIDFLEDSGKIVGDERLYTMEMTLSPAAQAPVKLPRSAAMVPISASHRLFQGMSVPVRYAAENPNLLMVEWDRI
jgi:hypothetical protein